MLSFLRRLGRFPTDERWWMRVGGWAVTGLAISVLTSFIVPSHYTSEATLRLLPAAISQDLVPHDNLDIGLLLEAVKPSALSRNVINNVITTFDLYPGERRRVPMEDVTEEFRKVVRIDSPGEKLIGVAFTYRDPILANKVTGDLVGRIISEMVTQRYNMSHQNVQFFQDQIDKIGESWLKLSAGVKATPPSDPRHELLVLARDEKRKEYELTTQKLGTAEILRDLADRGRDARLELLDAPTLPQEPDTPRSLFGLIGLGCGLAVGLISLLRRRILRPPAGFSIAPAEELA